MSLRNSDLTLYGTHVSNIRSVKALDKHTIQIIFSDVNDVAVENLIFSDLPKHIFKNITAVKTLLSLSLSVQDHIRWARLIWVMR